ncbi:MAG: hypothetical protein MUC66_00590 [Methanolinea sp.]|nr:hypothetical protein [Methanolinea sp.]
MERLSAEGKAGKILLLLGIVVGWSSVILFLLMGAFPLHSRMIPLHLFADHGVLLITIKVSGLILAMIALYCAEKDRFSLAGILGLIATILPPIDILLLLGSLLLLISPEGRGFSGGGGADPGKEKTGISEGNENA